MRSIRLATESDLDEIWALVCRAVAYMNALGNPQWGEDYPTRTHYADDIARGELYVVTTAVASASVVSAVIADAPERRILGVACINTNQAGEYAPLPWRIPSPAMVVHRMAVDPLVQRQGVARALFSFTEGLARREGIPAVHMDTYAQNDRMQALIKQIGFTKIGEVYFNRDARPLGYPCFEKVLSS